MLVPRPLTETDWAALLEPVARELLGDPVRRPASGEWRYRRKGSLAVHVAGPRRGTWRDHEADVGGGRPGARGEPFLGPSAGWQRLAPPSQDPLELCSRPTPSRNAWKLGERLPSRVRWFAILRAPSIFWNPLQSLWTSSEGLSRESGHR